MSKSSGLGVFAAVLLVATAAFAPPAPVPELDPGSVSLSAALLVGGLLVLLGQRKR